MDNSHLKSQCCLKKEVWKPQSVMVARIEDLGRARSLLESVLEEQMFKDLSKHNPYWESEHEVEADKLYDIRCNLRCLIDNLWEVVAILKHPEEGEV